MGRASICRGNFGSWDAESLLQILFVAHQHIDVLDDGGDRFDGAFVAARIFHSFSRKLRSKEVTAPAALASCIISAASGRGGRERGKDSAAVDPAHAAGKDGLPVEVAGLELGGGFVGAVVEDDRARTPWPRSL